MVLLAPVLLRLADVGLVAELGHALGLGEELLGLVGISFLEREVMNHHNAEYYRIATVPFILVHVSISGGIKFNISSIRPKTEVLRVCYSNLA